MKERLLAGPAFFHPGTATHRPGTRVPRRLCLLLCLLLAVMPALTVGCGSSGSSPAPETLTDGVWVGFQEGRDGAWQTLALSMEEAYDAIAGIDGTTGPYGIAVAMADSVDQEVSIVTLQADAGELSPGDLLELMERWMEDDDVAKTLTVNIIPPGEGNDPYAKLVIYAQSYFGRERTNISSDTWDLTESFGLDDHTFDLAATRYANEADTVPGWLIVHEGLTFGTADTLEESIDFSDPADFDALDASGQIYGFGDLLDSGYVRLLTPNGTMVKLGGDDENLSGSFDYAGISGALSASVDTSEYMYLAELNGTLQNTEQRFLYYYWFDEVGDWNFEGQLTPFEGACYTPVERGNILPTLDDTTYENAIAYALAYRGYNSGNGIGYSVISLVTEGWLGAQASSFSMPANLRDNPDWNRLWSIPSDTIEEGAGAMVIAGSIGFEDIRAILDAQDYWRVPRFEEGAWATILINGSIGGSSEFLAY